MNVFVAGASGAIGRPLIAELVRRGHAVTGMTRSDAGAKALANLGASVARVSAFDAEGLEQAVRAARPEVVIDQLTALPASPAGMAEAWSVASAVGRRTSSAIRLASSSGVPATFRDYASAMLRFCGEPKVQAGLPWRSTPQSSHQRLGMRPRTRAPASTRAFSTGRVASWRISTRGRERRTAFQVSQPGRPTVS